ncbi:alkaline phosphatase D family protein [Streptomyces sp. NPDC059740]|uniref:alkaline phosphatase D family protein n=1 Tax=Streptomyces sp. NPDC059740 TaxID=3346926 RepID=UPI00364AD357
MSQLRLGPLLRYVDEDSTTVWVETDRSCEVRVRCADGTQGVERTWQVAGHHYALVVVKDLTPGTETAYEVLLDGEKVWPEPDSPYPPSTIRTLPREPAEDHELRVTFGSCRWTVPPAGTRHDPVGPDALDTLARSFAREATATGGAHPADGAPSGLAPLPDVLALLGDQVYADQPSQAVADRIARRRDLSSPPGREVADYEEYTYLYDESWRDPDVRWLLSTVPSCMIFDDHDVVDDWNTSQAWLAEMRETSWWHDRIQGGLMSYWVYQHLGNLSPAELAADPLYARVRASEDGTAAVHEFTERADADPTTARWSYRRDFGRVRLVVVDCRAARVLRGESEGRRAMLDPDEAAWVRRQLLADPADVDHLLVGSSLPWLLPDMIHDMEGWNAAMCAGVRGPRWARRGERLRRKADLEHWPAFPSSFDDLSDILAEAASRADGPASVNVLSGDVHHSYAAEAGWRGTAEQARVWQLTCSPVHNSVPGYMTAVFRLGWSALGRRLGALLARHGRLPERLLTWRRAGGPWFGNHLMTLTLRGRSAQARLDRADHDETGGARLRTVWDRSLTAREPRQEHRQEPGS